MFISVDTEFMDSWHPSMVKSASGDLVLTVTNQL